MQQDEFALKWERDEKFKLLEQVESRYDEAKWMEAVELYKEALTEQPENPAYLHSYGYLLEMKANRFLREAAKCYQNGLESELLTKEYPWIKGKLNAQLIRVRAQLFENRKTIAFYKRELSKYPDAPETYGYLAQCYLQVDQVDEAKKAVEAGLKIFPKQAMLHYYQGEIFSRRGKVEQALEAWEHSAVLDPQLIDGRFSRAFLFEREQRLEEAVKEWKVIVEFMDKYNFHAEFPKKELKRIETLLR